MILPRRSSVNRALPHRNKKKSQKQNSFRPPVGLLAWHTRASKGHAHTANSPSVPFPPVLPLVSGHRIPIGLPIIPLALVHFCPLGRSWSLRCIATRAAAVLCCYASRKRCAFVSSPGLSILFPRTGGDRLERIARGKLLFFPLGCSPSVMCRSDHFAEGGSLAFCGSVFSTFDF
jgi:hypothetical protein